MKPILMLVGLVASLAMLMAAIFGDSSDDAPASVTVTVTKSSTVTVTKTKTSTVKKNIFPDSCRVAVELLVGVVSSQGELTKQSGKIADAASDAQVIYSTGGSHSSLVKAIQRMIDAKEKLDTVVVGNSEEKDSATNQLSVCLEHIGGEM